MRGADLGVPYRDSFRRPCIACIRAEHDAPKGNEKAAQLPEVFGLTHTTKDSQSK
jgi:hypothetical protein